MDEVTSHELSVEETVEEVVEETTPGDVIEVPSEEVAAEVVDAAPDVASEATVVKPKKKKKAKKKTPVVKKEKVEKVESTESRKRIRKAKAPANVELVHDVETWKSVAPLKMSVPVFVVAGALSSKSSSDKMTENEVLSAIRSFLGQSLH